MMGADTLADPSNHTRGASDGSRQAGSSDKSSEEAGDDARESASASTVCGDDLQLLSCHESYIYVLTSLRHATISGCTDCHIMLGAVSGGVTVSGCERCSITLASRSLTVANCSDTSLYVLCNTPPLIVGDSRGVEFAPHNTRYATLGAHLAVAQISTEPRCNYWDCLRTLTASGAEPSTGEGEEGSQSTAAADDGVRLMAPESFTLRLAPFAFAAESAPGATTALPCALPQAYAAAIAAHRARVDQIRAIAASVASAEGDEMAEAETGAQLPAVIHGHFKDWLARTGNLSQINELLQFDLETAAKLATHGATSPYSAPPVTPTKPAR